MIFGIFNMLYKIAEWSWAIVAISLAVFALGATLKAPHWLWFVI